MVHALVTVAAPLPVADIPRALERIEALGNPARADLAQALDRLDGDDGIHFVSLHAIAPTDPARPAGHIVLELSADGTDEAAIARLVDRIGPALAEVFALAEDRGSAALAAYLLNRRLILGVGWTGRTGLAFAGTPGMSVGRIRKEADLARALTAVLEAEGGGLDALTRLARVRAAVGADPALSWALGTPDPLPPTPKTGLLALILALAANFAVSFLWPGGLALAVILAVSEWAALRSAPPGLLAQIGAGLMTALAVFGVAVAALLAKGLWLYLSLRAREESDPVDERAPEHETMRAILERENHYAQNHMVSVTARKPGLVRRITTRLAFWLIAQLATLQFRPGRLGEIGTIHFARWVMLPGGRDFVFFSNYGGSWESYLEDFITKAHNGLTAVWSNTVGFPRSRNLFQLGATDGERFKRFARRSMAPTPFWYSAYPTLTTDHIRSHAAMRCGLAAAMTEDEAAAWLDLFGSAARPAAKLESDQIQSLVFGGLGFLPFGEALLVEFDSPGEAARSWLAGLAPHIAWDDGRRLRREAVITLALGPGALAAAGLPKPCLDTFPIAFLDGMTGPGRARILGDDAAAPEAAWWWGQDRSPDAAVLVYGESEAAVETLAGKVRTLGERCGARLVRAIPLRPVPDAPHEPFGFLDGVSQPVIRGTYRGLRNPDPIHLVEPGEFVLGYPDNRGNRPPGPQLDPLYDPDNRLPVLADGAGDFAENLVNRPREVARNGSFLVIRQLEQDVEAFQAYCQAEAGRLKNRLPAPYDITPSFIAAKLVGRWPDGSSLVRNPYQAFTDAGDRERGPVRRPESRPARGGAVPAAVDRRDLRRAPEPPHAGRKAAASAAPDPDEVADNDFLFGAEDPQGIRCPYGAHIRRANPRESLDPGSQDQIDISNRHRIIRVGRGYRPEEGQKPGLLFMCLNGDIERQFEFVQQTWMGSPAFHGLSGERDPLSGHAAGCPQGYTVPTRDGPVRLAPMSRFVTPRGGGYFFLPGKALVEFLSAPLAR